MSSKEEFSTTTHKEGISVMTEQNDGLSSQQSVQSPSKKSPNKKALEDGTGIVMPPGRIKAIMRSSPESLAISSDALFAMARATEQFIQLTARETYAMSGNAGTLDYTDLAEYVQDKEELDFLHEIVPRKIKAADIWNLIEGV